MAERSEQRLAALVDVVEIPEHGHHPVHRAGMRHIDMRRETLAARRAVALDLEFLEVVREQRVTDIAGIALGKPGGGRF